MSEIVINGKYSVDKECLSTSGFFSSVVSTCGDQRNLFLPETFPDHTVWDYIHFVNQKQPQKDDLKSCLMLSHYLEDQQYFEHLVFDRLFKHWSTHKSIVNELNPMLQEEIYFLLPLVLMPSAFFEKLIQDSKLSDKWIKENSNRKIIIDDTVLVMIDIIPTNLTKFVILIRMLIKGQLLLRV